MFIFNCTLGFVQIKSAWWLQKQRQNMLKVEQFRTLERWIFETTSAVIMALHWVRPPCDLHKYFTSATVLIKTFRAGCRHQAHSQQVARDLYGSHFIFCPNTPIVFHENTQDPFLRITIHKSEKYHILWDRLVVSLLTSSGCFTFYLIHFKHSVGNWSIKCFHGFCWKILWMTMTNNSNLKERSNLKLPFNCIKEC